MSGNLFLKSDGKPTQLIRRESIYCCYLFKTDSRPILSLRIPHVNSVLEFLKTHRPKSFRNFRQTSKNNEHTFNVNNKTLTK